MNLNDLRKGARLAAQVPDEEFVLWSVGRGEAEIRAELGRRTFKELVLARSQPWAHVHRAADKFRPAMLKVAAASFAAGLKKVSPAALRATLTARDEQKVIALASSAITATETAFAAEHGMGLSFEQVLQDVLTTSGKASAKQLQKQLKAATIRTAAPKIKGFEFDNTNPNAVEWIKQHAAETISGISDTTREEIREAVESAFEDQFDVDQLASDIEDILGDGDGDRAEMIARTETMRASNEGQQQAWDQAVEEGLLTGHELQVWIVTPDDRLCPVCEPLDGETTDLDGTWEVDGENIDGPPAHPNCRCTVGLQLPKGGE